MFWELYSSEMSFDKRWWGGQGEESLDQNDFISYIPPHLLPRLPGSWRLLSNSGKRIFFFQNFIEKMTALKQKQ